MLKKISRKVIAKLRVMLVILAAALGLPMLANPHLATNELKLYRSEAGSFEVKYPNNWSATEANKGNSLVVLFTSPRVRDYDVFQAAKIMVCSTPIEETAWNDCTERDSHLSELSKDSVRYRRDFVAGGLKIEIVETASRYDDGFFYYARFSSNERKFFVRGNFRKSFNPHRYAPVFDKMLESFRLLSAAKLNKAQELTAR